MEESSNLDAPRRTIRRTRSRLRQASRKNFQMLCGFMGLLIVICALAMVIRGQAASPGRKMDVQLGDESLVDNLMREKPDANTPEVICLFFTAVFAIFLKSATGFGDGISYQVGYWSFASLGILHKPSLLQSVIIAVIGFVPVTWMNACWLFARADWSFTLTLWAAKVTGATVGSYVLVSMHNIWITRSLGLALLCTLFISLYKDYVMDKTDSQSVVDNPERDVYYMIPDSEQEGETWQPFYESDSDDDFFVPLAYIMYGDDRGQTPDAMPLSEVPKSNLFLAAFLAGIFAGLFGVGGAPMMVFGLFYKLDHGPYSAAVTISGGFGNGLVTLLYSGVISGGLVVDQYPLYLAVIGGSFVGFGIGRLTAGAFSQRIFLHLLRFLLFCGAILMISIRFGQVAHIISMGVGVCILSAVVGLMGYLWLMSFRNSKNKDEYVTAQTS